MTNKSHGKACPCCGYIITRNGCLCDAAEQAGIALPDPALMDHPQSWHLAVADYHAALALLAIGQSNNGRNSDSVVL